MIQGHIGKTLLAGIGLAAALLAPLPGWSPSARAATVVAQPPCVNDEAAGFCVSFGASGRIPNIRRRVFGAPSAGKAVVMFHGALTCVNFTGVKGWVQLSSQIVDNPDASPNPIRPGGLTHLATLPPEGRATFNLASTRVFTIPSAGTYTFYFKVRRVALEPAGSDCRVFNAAFTITFEPEAP